MKRCDGHLPSRQSLSQTTLCNLQKCCLEDPDHEVIMNIFMVITSSNIYLSTRCHKPHRLLVLYLLIKNVWYCRRCLLLHNKMQSDISANILRSITNRNWICLSLGIYLLVGNKTKRAHLEFGNFGKILKITRMWKQTPSKHPEFHILGSQCQCKFGSFQPYLTNRQTDWSTTMFI